MSFSEEQKATTTEVLTAFNKIPYVLINAEIDGSARDTLSELTKICEYYRIYKKVLSSTQKEQTAIMCLQN